MMTENLGEGRVEQGCYSSERAIEAQRSECARLSSSENFWITIQTPRAPLRPLPLL